MLVRGSERGREGESERERERAVLKEPRANEMEAAEISQKIIPHLHCMGVKQHPPVTEGESIICMGNRVI